MGHHRWGADGIRTDRLAAGDNDGQRGDQLPCRADEVDPYAYVITLNIHRRHLTTEKRIELVEKIHQGQPGNVGAPRVEARRCISNDRRKGAKEAATEGRRVHRGHVD